MRSIASIAVLTGYALARPKQIAARAGDVVVWETRTKTTTTEQIVATVWKTDPAGNVVATTVPAPTPQAQAIPTAIAILQEQVLVNQVLVQYSYSSARTVFVVPTTVTSTVTQTATVAPYLSSGSTVTPPASTTLYNTINAITTPADMAERATLVGTLPAISVRIGQATVAVSEQSFTYYAPTPSYGAYVAPDATTLPVSDVSTATPVSSTADMPVVSASAAQSNSGSSSSAATKTSSSAAVFETSSTDSTSSMDSSTSTTSKTSSTSSTSSTSTIATPTSISESNDSTFVNTMLYTINAYRGKHNVPQLQWDASLATAALNYAQSCVLSPSSDSSFGETLAAGSSADPQFYVSVWYNQGQNYNYQNPGFSQQTGQFTQLMWASTTTVGCGFSSGCGGQFPNYMVCRYTTPGNVVGGDNNNQFFIQNVLE